MEKENLDDNGMIKVAKGNVYLIKEVNYTEYKSIFEWECLEVSDTSYKFIDKITERVFWVEKDRFYRDTFGPRGYHVFECIFDLKKQQEENIKNIIK